MKPLKQFLPKKEFTLYTLVCAICFSVDFLLLILLTEYAHLHYLLSGLIGFIAGNIANYFLSTKYVFAKRKFNERQAMEFQIFMLIGLSSLLVHHASFWFFTDMIDLVYQLSKLIATGMSFFWTFFIRRYFLFS